MNEQAQQVLADMLERALSGVDAAVEFSQAQIPDVVEQLLMWHMFKSALFFSTGLAMILISAWCIWYVFKDLEGAVDSFNQEGAAVIILMLVFLFTGGVIVTYTHLDWIQMLIAPKLYLLEYAASLVK